ncbi:ABC transporter substrate-binding protein [Cognaticolwellia mytili]|uniref:ABC transporter substrate-binding protein n=1 Tax=Cognaticolwellia mytili TaxID=1888913 RepID=UPI001301E6E5|nr:ABC transporter substrate-binding protein [Cognaticolwellia mytili]
MIFFLLNSLFSASICARNFTVVFLNPGYPESNATGNFWANVTRFMVAAADDLNINLLTIYAYRNHVLMKSLAQQVIEQKPDYVILVNEKGIALNIVKKIAEHKIPVFMLLNTLSSDEYDLLSQDEKKFLIGSLTPDNYQVGKKLSDDLIKAYLKQNSRDNMINFFVLQGDHTTPAATARVKGFSDSIKAHENINLIDNTVANWSKQQAYQKVKGVLQRDRIDIIWSANDAMAFGAKKAVLEAELIYQPIIGGINWDVSDEGYTIDISYGGHVTLGAYAMAMLKGIDDKVIVDEEKYQLIDIFESSHSKHFSLFEALLVNNELSRYDFARFGEDSTTKMKFSIENLIETLK